MDIEAFGQRLKELRNNKSQADIVKLIFEKTGISITAQTYGRYENGKRKPDIEIIEALANTFDVSADYLLCRTDIATTSTDIQMICEYTGLSEKAIQTLIDCKANGKSIAIIVCEGKNSHAVTFSGRTSIITL